MLKIHKSRKTMWHWNIHREKIVWRIERRMYFDEVWRKSRRNILYKALSVHAI